MTGMEVAMNLLVATNYFEYISGRESINSNMFRNIAPVPFGHRLHLRVQCGDDARRPIGHIVPNWQHCRVVCVAVGPDIGHS